MLSRSFILKTAAMPPVRALVTQSPLFRPLVKRFIAGQTLDEAMGQVESLADDGYLVTLDQLGENVSSAAEAQQAADNYIQIVRRLASSRHRPRINISIKLTQLGLDLGEGVAEAHYRALLSEAAKDDIFVRVDMEASEYTERTIRMVERVFPDLPNTGTVLQSYLKRTLDDVERLIALGCRVRMVKGAYLEPATVAYQDKQKVDEVYVEATRRLLERGNYPAIATQDEAIIVSLQSFIKEKRIAPERYEWQMLYGIRRDLQAGLKQSGESVRLYVPYGPSWYPYFTRRLAERPANMLFFVRSLLRK